mgnify:CR=1 FL=1
MQIKILSTDSSNSSTSREILTDLLRDEMNFDGVIVTDSMTMQGVADYFDTNERNLLAVKAGVDILDIPFTDMSCGLLLNERNPITGLLGLLFTSASGAKLTFTPTAFNSLPIILPALTAFSMSPAAKHFPGHGNVATDSHTGLPSVPATKEELYATELVPFQAAIDAGTDLCHH